MRGEPHRLAGLSARGWKSRDPSNPRRQAPLPLFGPQRRISCSRFGGCHQYLVTVNDALDPLNVGLPPPFEKATAMVVQPGPPESAMSANPSPLKSPATASTPGPLAQDGLPYGPRSGLWTRSGTETGIVDASVGVGLQRGGLDARIRRAAPSPIGDTRGYRSPEYTHRCSMSRRRRGARVERGEDGRRGASTGPHVLD
jgi:hypothetical protein